MHVVPQSALHVSALTCVETCLTELLSVLLQVEQLIDGGRAFLADTILFLVFYSPTIDNADVPAWYHIQSAPDPRQYQTRH